MGLHTNVVVACELSGKQIPRYVTRDGDIVPGGKELILKLLALGAVSAETSVPLYSIASSVFTIDGFKGFIGIMSDLVCIHVANERIGKSSFPEVAHIYLNMDNPITRREVEARTQNNSKNGKS